MSLLQPQPAPSPLSISLASPSSSAATSRHHIPACTRRELAPSMVPAPPSPSHEIQRRIGRRRIWLLRRLDGADPDRDGEVAGGSLLGISEEGRNQREVHQRPNDVSMPASDGGGLHSKAERRDGTTASRASWAEADPAALAAGWNRSGPRWRGSRRRRTPRWVLRLFHGGSRRKRVRGRLDFFEKERERD